MLLNQSEQLGLNWESDRNRNSTRQKMKFSEA